MPWIRRVRLPSIWLWPALAIVAVSAGGTFLGPPGALLATGELGVCAAASALIVLSTGRWRRLSLGLAPVLVSLPLLAFFLG